MLSLLITLLLLCLQHLSLNLLHTLKLCDLCTINNDMMHHSSKLVSLKSNLLRSLNSFPLVVYLYEGDGSIR